MTFYNAFISDMIIGNYIREDKVIVMKLEDVFITIPILFSLIMIVSGVIAFKFPLAWESKDNTWRYPRFDNKVSRKNKEKWIKGQSVYGKLMMLMGVINLLISKVLVAFMVQVIDNIWKSENATIPAVIFLCLPSFVLMFLANFITKIILEQNFNTRRMVTK